MATDEIKRTQENTSFIINESSKPNSYEFGKASNRFKIYFDTPEDLKEQIDRLKELGIYKPELEG